MNDPNTWHLTPDSYTSPDDGTTTHSGNPIQDVIGADHWSSSGKNRPRLCKPGDTLQLGPGLYHHFRWTHTLKPEDKPITIQGVGKATRIKQNPVSGSQTHYLEWGGRYMLRDLVIEGDDIVAFGTERPASDRWNGTHPGFEDVHLRNVSIDGGYNWSTATGPKRKWGMLNYALGQSSTDKPGFSWEGGGVSGIFKEHAFYFHNPAGDISFRKMLIKGCGRTAFQFASREGEGPEGRGNVFLQDIVIRDVCIGDGGSAISINGGHDGDFLLHDVSVKLGSSRDLHPDYAERVTGCVVTHRGGGSYPVKPSFKAKGCEFVVGRFHKGKGGWRRPNLNISNLAEFKLANTEVWSYPGCREAMVLDMDTIDKVSLDETNDVRGECVLLRGGERLRFPDPQWDGSGYRLMLENL